MLAPSSTADLLECIDEGIAAIDRVAVAPSGRLPLSVDLPALRAQLAGQRAYLAGGGRPDLVDRDPAWIARGLLHHAHDAH